MHFRNISDNPESVCQRALRFAGCRSVFLVMAFSCAWLSHGAARAQEAGATTGGDQAGIIKVVRGDVQVQRGSATAALPAKVGDRVFAGDRLITAADAAAGITLRDDTLMSLGPKSSLVLERYDFDATAGDGNVAVRVLKGTMRYVTGLIGKHAPDHQQVLTPTATIGIRGTDFIVDVVSSE